MSRYRLKIDGILLDVDSFKVETNPYDPSRPFITVTITKVYRSGDVELLPSGELAMSFDSKNEIIPLGEFLTICPKCNTVHPARKHEMKG